MQSFNYYTAKNPSMSHLLLSKWYKHLFHQTAQPQILTLFSSVSEIQPCFHGARITSGAAVLFCIIPGAALSDTNSAWLFHAATACHHALPPCYWCWEVKPRTHGHTTSDSVLLWQSQVTCSYRFLSAICSFKEKHGFGLPKISLFQAAFALCTLSETLTAPWAHESYKAYLYTVH